MAAQALSVFPAGLGPSPFSKGRQHSFQGKRRRASARRLLIFFQRSISHHNADLAAFVGRTVIIDGQVIGESAAGSKVVEPSARYVVIALHAFRDREALAVVGEPHHPVDGGKGGTGNIPDGLQREPICHHAVRALCHTAEQDRKSTRLNSSHPLSSRMPSSA